MQVVDACPHTFVVIVISSVYLESCKIVSSHAHMNRIMCNRYSQNGTSIVIFFCPGFMKMEMDLL